MSARPTRRTKPGTRIDGVAALCNERWTLRQCFILCQGCRQDYTSRDIARSHEWGCVIENRYLCEVSLSIHTYTAPCNPCDVARGLIRIYPRVRTTSVSAKVPCITNVQCRYRMSAPLLATVFVTKTFAVGAIQSPCPMDFSPLATYIYTYRGDMKTSSWLYKRKIEFYKTVYQYENKYNTAI